MNRPRDSRPPRSTRHSTRRTVVASSAWLSFVVLVGGCGDRDAGSRGQSADNARAEEERHPASAGGTAGKDGSDGGKTPDEKRSDADADRPDGSRSAASADEADGSEEVATPSGEGGKRSLRLSFKPGRTHHIRTIADRTIEQRVGDEKMTMEQFIGRGMKMTVEKVRDDGAAVVSVRYTWLKFEQTGGPTDVAYDSSDPPEEVPLRAKGLAGLVGSAFQVVLGQTGRVLEVRGVGKMRKEILGSVDVAEDQKPLVETIMKKVVSEERLRATLEQIGPQYPDEPVAAGDSWSRTATGNAVVPLSMDHTWTLRRREDGVATIGLESSFGTGDGERKHGPMGMQYDISGEQSGQIQVRVATGWVVAASIEQKMSGRIRMTSAGRRPLTIPTNVEGRITITAGEAPPTKGAADGS